jgi:mono/diheme cytochrome c family protein
VPVERPNESRLPWPGADEPAKSAANFSPAGEKSSRAVRAEGRFAPGIVLAPSWCSGMDFAPGRHASNLENPMNRLSLATLLCLSVGSIVSAQTPAARGQQVYTEQKCSICHSVAGAGNKKGALDNVGAKLSSDEIRSWITAAPAMAAKAKADRKPAMKAYTLPKDELDALVSYLQTLKTS